MLFEDFAIGNRYELGRHTFTAEDIIQFASRYDPQPFHTDEVAAARSHFPLARIPQLALAPPRVRGGYAQLRE
jgi:acyl dehydratase